MSCPGGRRLLLVVPLLALNALLLYDVIGTWTQGRGGSDWSLFVRVTYMDPYSWPSWRWSPVAVWLFTGIVPMGLLVWQALHLAAVELIPEWRLRIVLLLAAPFWWDLVAGNVMVFVFVAAYWMLRGNPLGTFATLALALLVPRPLMLPLILWVLWTQPAWRFRFAAMFAVHAALVLVSGQGMDWLRNLVAGQSEVGHPFNLSPSGEIGLAWMVVAAPVAAWAFARGRVGLAAMLASPYWLPNYLLVALLDVRRAAAGEARAGGVAAVPAHLGRAVRYRSEQDSPRTVRYGG